jgi:hypothetical protein
MSSFCVQHQVKWRPGMSSFCVQHQVIWFASLQAQARADRALEVAAEAKRGKAAAEAERDEAYQYGRDAHACVDKAEEAQGIAELVRRTATPSAPLPSP